MNDWIIDWFRQLSRQARSVGPFLAMALVVPGGSVLALLLWLYQRRHGKV